MNKKQRNRKKNKQTNQTNPAAAQATAEDTTDTAVVADQPTEESKNESCTVEAQVIEEVVIGVDQPKAIVSDTVVVKEKVKIDDDDDYKEDQVDDVVLERQENSVPQLPPKEESATHSSDVNNQIEPPGGTEETKELTKEVAKVRDLMIIPRRPSKVTLTEINGKEFDIIKDVNSNQEERKSQEKDDQDHDAKALLQVSDSSIKVDSKKSGDDNSFEAVAVGEDQVTPNLSIHQSEEEELMSPLDYLEQSSHHDSTTQTNMFAMEPTRREGQSVFNKRIERKQSLQDVLISDEDFAPYKNKEFMLQRQRTYSFLYQSQNMLGMLSNQSLACIERIKECKTFGKFLYERKQFEEAQKQFEEALRYFRELHNYQVKPTRDQQHQRQQVPAANKATAYGTGSTQSLINPNNLIAEDIDSEDSSHQNDDVNFFKIQTPVNVDQTNRSPLTNRDLTKKVIRSQSNLLLFNRLGSKQAVQGGDTEAISLKEGTNSYHLVLECHINIAMCQIHQSLFLHAIMTLTTVLQYSRQDAQAFYLRGKCYYCLFDYKNAYMDISECRRIYTQTLRQRHGESAAESACPTWLINFQTSLGKKISGGVNSQTTMTTHQNYLSRLIAGERTTGGAGDQLLTSGISRGGKSSAKTISSNSTKMAEMESYAWIDRMWKRYTPEGLTKQAKPSIDKLIKMFWIKSVERVKAFDAHFLFFWVFLFFYLGVKKRLFFKIGWLLFKQIKQLQSPVALESKALP